MPLINCNKCNAMKPMERCKYNVIWWMECNKFNMFNAVYCMQCNAMVFKYKSVNKPFVCNDQCFLWHLMIMNLMKLISLLHFPEGIVFPMGVPHQGTLLGSEFTYMKEAPKSAGIVCQIAGIDPHCNISQILPHPYVKKNF